MCRNLPESFFFIFTLSPEFARNTFPRKVCSFLSLPDVRFSAHRVLFYMSIFNFTTGWTVWGSNTSSGRDFPHLSRPALGITRLPIQGVRVYFRAQSFPSSFEVKERVELYLYSPSGLPYSVKLLFYLISEGL